MKTLHFGVAIILFGLTIEIAFNSNGLGYSQGTILGLIVSVIGMIISIIGFFRNEHIKG
ncbi:hypothetical protein FJQ98_14540 [Lysinibacillus agricola]|uniref:Uncharacterized protein n=1 Tax=Lysinibacillus agricola TaxID=2590012 RepID=A0ABX7ALG4_9BACI|nr:MULTISPECIES: hypothetical protein [Lysinibacillus]QQP10499.1 hypothetical protein FJQ98_14540 [Lysinibacillus agricola]